MEAREIGTLISSILGVSRPQVSGDPGNDPALDRVTDLLETWAEEFRMDVLDAVMYSVDKWFDKGDPRLKKNPETRAADAREIALRAIESKVIPLEVLYGIHQLPLENFEMAVKRYMFLCGYTTE